MSALSYTEMRERLFSDHGEGYGEREEKMLQSVAPQERAAWFILDSLADRREFRHVWEGFTADVKNEIFSDMAALILEQMCARCDAA